MLCILPRKNLRSGYRFGKRYNNVRSLRLNRCNSNYTIFIIERILEWKLTNVLNWKYVTNKKTILNIFHFVIRGENPCSMWYANYFHTSFETLILEEKKVLWARKYWIIKNLVTNRLISFGRERKKSLWNIQSTQLSTTNNCYRRRVILCKMPLCENHQF